jgi:ribosomal protein L20
MKAGCIPLEKGAVGQAQRKTVTADARGLKHARVAQLHVSVSHKMKSMHAALVERRT